VLIPSAFAADAAPAADAMTTLGQFLPLIVIFVLFWFMLIRPQMKQAKEQRKLIEALQKGDEVTTSAGIVGRITKVADGYVSLEIAPDTVITVQKHTVSTLLPKGTIKAL